MTTIDPEAILEDLKYKASRRKTKTLDLIYAVLKKQTKSGALDFSIATIGRLSSAAGGPSTQAIRNKGGIEYRQLIEAWAASQGTTTKKPLSPTNHQKLPTKDEDLLRCIEDPPLRAVFGTIIAERNKLLSENRLLKTQTIFLIDRRPVRQSVQPTLEFLPSLNGMLTNMERDALKAAISDKLFAERGWTIQVNGRVKDEDGRLLYMPGYVMAIKKIIGESNNG
ncbi:MAG: hypothetical protein JAZ11_13465 [Candidatus Thiodiazotropha lotti]|nr:hypothetical protein [Candidatus Thiodiazotropha lotti]